MSDQNALVMLRHEAHAIEPQDEYAFLLQEVGDASIVLLGEATHGSHEFYHARAKISQRLIQEKGFDAIAVEADWPDALCVNSYVKNTTPADHLQPKHALDKFQRFPLWMWRNTEIVKLVMWLQQHNAGIAAHEQKIGFFGLDLYSLHSSMQSVVQYLEKVDPQAAQQARARYSCFDHVAQDPQQYGYATAFGMKKDCEEEVLRQLIALTTNAAQYLTQDGSAAADELFYAQQNARVAQHAEAYYRSMFRGRDESWNLRDTHMADTLYALREHISKQKGHPAKIIVWAHNSHIGDARATEMGDHGQLNLGQLIRERNPSAETFLLGFTTHTGTVTAASEWDRPAELKGVNPSRADSYENLFHRTGLGNFFVPIRSNKYLKELLLPRRLERAIGVIYVPHSERLSHYFHASIADQFDGVMHFDETHALHPLDRTAHWSVEDAPDTYPFGM
jgi:erythromycin esterase-like protein